MLEHAISPLKKYARFQGRARRLEYWSFTLLCVCVYLVLTIPAFFLRGTGPFIDPAAPLGINPAAVPFIGLMALFGLAVMIPGIAVAVRRLHDRNMSGWWYLGFALMGMIPFVGWIANIAFVVILFLPGTPGPNRFGDDPRDPMPADVFA